jgi:glycosyltransferase involved in cell wall biosynthesis
LSYRFYFTRDYTTHDRRFLAALSGTTYQVYFLQLERRGHSLEDRPLPEGINRVPWKGGQAPAHAWDGPRLLADFKRVLKEIKPDLVHAGPLQTSALLVALAGFKPLVSMSWGYDLLKDADRNVFWKWATRYSLQHSAMMVGDCDTIRQRAIELGMPEERIVTFPWGIDLNNFTPARSGHGSHQPFKLLSTRGWELIYGVNVLVRAFVKAARQNQDLRLSMLGNGSQADEIQRILSEGGVIDRVDFLDKSAKWIYCAIIAWRFVYQRFSHRRDIDFPVGSDGVWLPGPGFRYTWQPGMGGTRGSRLVVPGWRC